MRTGRERRIERIRQRLLRKSMPRLIVTLILSMTAISAFLTSFVLLGMGVLKMWVRYPSAILVAYLVFLLLLAIWLWLRRRTPEPDVDALELAITKVKRKGLTNVEFRKGDLLDLDLHAETSTR